MNKDFQDSRPHSPRFDGASADCEPEDSRILEGEVVGKIPEKRSPPQNSTPPPEFKIFSLAFAKLKRNCLFASLAFFAFTFFAIYLQNWWLFLLAILLPPWIFSQKKF